MQLGKMLGNLGLCLRVACHTAYLQLNKWIRIPLNFGRYRPIHLTLDPSIKGNGLTLRTQSING